MDEVGGEETLWGGMLLVENVLGMGEYEYT